MKRFMERIGYALASLVLVGLLAFDLFHPRPASAQKPDNVPVRLLDPGLLHRFDLPTGVPLRLGASHRAPGLVNPPITGSSCEFGQPDFGAHCTHSGGNQGLLGTSEYGIYGEHSNGTFGYIGGIRGVEGRHGTGNWGVLGSNNEGVFGRHSNGNTGRMGTSTQGVLGEHSNGNTGRLGTSDYAVYGEHSNGTFGYIGGIRGVEGRHGTGNWGVLGSNNEGVFGRHSNGNTGRIGHADGAGVFEGDVTISGNLSKGGGSFKIDHPLDPANQYLSHSFVESPDMINVYNGNVTTDAQGEAIVELPSYFEALNRDFRYQLTVIGTFAQAIVAEEIQGNRFVIRTDQAYVKVSWQVTGIRQDPWANENRIVVEEVKPPEERGFYLHPQRYGHSAERGVEWARQSGNDLR